MFLISISDLPDEPLISIFLAISWLGSGQVFLLQAGLVKKNTRPWAYFKNACLAPPTGRRTMGSSSDYQCENLLGLLEVNETHRSVCAPLRLNITGVFNFQTCSH